MTTGIARRVVVVRPPDQTLFDQAIFLLRDQAQPGPAADVLRQAQQVADDYLLRTSPRARARRGLRDLLFALLGGGLTAAGLVLAGLLPLPF